MVARKMFRFCRKTRDNTIISSLSFNDNDSAPLQSVQNHCCYSHGFNLILSSVSRAINFGLWNCCKSAHSPWPLPPGEVPPEGRGRGIVQTVRGGMQFVRYIDAVVLWVDCRSYRCSYPSQALRASSPVGRAKGSVGIVDGAFKSDLRIGLKLAHG